MSTKIFDAFVRGTLGIYWVDRITNGEVRNIMAKEREIRRNEQRYGLLQLILRGKVSKIVRKDQNEDQFIALKFMRMVQHDYD